nr:hypothetical protein [Sporosarcina sp.]
MTKGVENMARNNTFFQMRLKEGEDKKYIKDRAKKIRMSRNS